MTTQSGMLRRSANHFAKYPTLCSNLLFFLFRNAIGKKVIQLAIDQPVSRGSKGALGPITRQLKLREAAKMEVEEATYFGCRKAPRALVLHQHRYQIPASFRSIRQNLCPRFGGILLELEFAPIREIASFLWSNGQKQRLAFVVNIANLRAISRRSVCPAWRIGF